MIRRFTALWTAWTFLLALTAVPSTAWGDEPAPAEPAAEATPEAPYPVSDGPVDPPVTPLELGAPAPYDGYLMSERRLLEYTGLQIRLRTAEWNLEYVQDSAEKAIGELQSRLATASNAAEPGFFMRHGLVIGFVLGIVGTGLLVWAAVSVLDTQTSTE